VDKIKEGLKSKNRKGIIIISIAIITMAINILLSYFPKKIELLYSNGLNKKMIQLISLFTGLFPFSIGELLVLFLFLLLVVLFLWAMISIFRKKLLRSLIIIGAYLSFLYIGFIGLWGLNYHRVPLEEVIGITVDQYSTQDLIDLSQYLIQEANNLRSSMIEDEHGVTQIPGGYRSIFERAQKGYDQLSIQYQELGGNYGRPKPIFLSKAMLYTGITGIYMPYTGEANVNILAEDYTLPATTMHEMAHQRGYAREEEANYIAYLTCLTHEDLDFQYSGTMLALVYSMNALKKYDHVAYQDLRASYSEGVRRDLQYSYDLWHSYEGKVEEVASRMNDQYLKSNGQKSGVKSYGKMVDLLLADYRRDKN